MNIFELLRNKLALNREEDNEILENKDKQESKKELSNEVVVPSLASVRPPAFYDTVAYRITPNGLYNIVQDLKTGYARDFLTLAEELEEKDPHYRSVIGTRKSQVVSLDCQVLPYDDSEKAAEISEDVNNTIVKAPYFRKMLLNLMDAVAKGYSVCEIIWKSEKGKWLPVDVKWRDPRYFRYDKETLSHVVLEEAGREIELPLNKFIIHEPMLKSGLQIKAGLALPCAYYLLIKSVDVAGWAAFAQVYGYPLRIGKYGRSASATDKKVLKRAIASLGHDIGAIIPENMKIEIINAMTSGGGNITLYKELADWCDKEISKCVLGQTMSTDAEGGQYKGDLHNEIRLEIKRSDAKQLAETIQRDLITPYVNFNYGDAYIPEFKIVVPEPEDVPGLVAAIEKLVPLGLKVKSDELYAKLGLSKPEDGDDILGIEKIPNSEPEMNSQKLSLNRAENPEIDDDLEALIDEETEKWEELASPFLEALEKAINECKTIDEFKDKLIEIEKHFEVDSELAEKIALSTFKARVLGWLSLDNQE